MENIYQKTLNSLLELPLIREWPAMQEILTKTCSNQPRVWQMPPLACVAVGGSETEALPAVGAMACLQLSLIFVDDLLDEEPNGLQHRYGGTGRAANLASALQAAGSAFMAQSPINPSLRLAVLDSFHQTLLTTAYGQSLDSQNPADEEAYWRVVRLKSNPCFGTAFYLGALFGSASPDLANRLREIGSLYGEMTQILDDLNDSLAVPANPDWLQGRSSLPILFAQVVKHPQQARFYELRQLLSASTTFEPAILSDAQQILWSSGAVSYCVDQFVRRYKKVRQLLAAMPLVTRAEIERLFMDLGEPVWSLFNTYGVSGEQLGQIIKKG